MDLIEIHLLHGFLGLPDDWKKFKEVLSKEIKGKGILCRFQSHNLWEDFEEVIETSPHGHTNYLEVWGQQKYQKIAASKEKKFFIGYSLGGRLLMHLPVHDLQNVKGVAMLASHPGIDDSKKRQQRLVDDCFWSERFIDEQWSDILNSWNAQSVFAHDKKRPKRQENRYNRKLLARYFKEWGMGIQKPRDEQIASAGAPYYWFYGAKDSKFAALLPRMKKLVGPNHCFKVNEAGHGCHWDNPEHLAQLLVPLMLRG